MFRGVLSNRMILAGLVFFVVVVGGSLLHSWHVRRTTQQIMETHNRFLERKPDKHNGEYSIEPVAVPNTSDTAETPPTPTALTTASNSESVSAIDMFLPEHTATEETDIEEDVPVSPHGFGPYPELPEGWSPYTFPTSTPEHELLKRVRIKLISQGINAEGTAYRDNLIYPIIRGILHVEWRYSDGPAGMRKYIGLRFAHPADYPRIVALEEETYRTRSSFPAAQVPPDIQLIPFPEGGIDPYKFLNLDRK